MPDIRLPSGKIIKGVPEGTPKEVVMQKAIAAGLATESDFGLDAQKQGTQQVPQQPEQSGLSAGLETAATMISGALAQPVAGVAGLVQSINPFAEEGAGAKAVEDVSKALTYQGGERSKEQLQDVGEFIAPVAEKLSQAERFLGEETLELTGSPFLASIAHTLPTAALEVLGFKGSKSLRAPKQVSKNQVAKAMVESAPEAQKIKQAARQVYQEIDNAGAVIKKESLQNLAKNIERKTKAKGMDPRTTKVSSGVVDSIKESAMSNQKLTELDTLRNVAKAAAKSTDPTEKMLGVTIMDEIEGFMDNMKSTDLIKGSESLADTAKKYKAARKLYGRAKRSELINEAITEGQNARSGVENGIRNELHKITRNKKLRKFFPKKELDAMNEVVQGDFKTNFAKMVGRMGFMEGSSTSVLGSLGGVYAGSSVLGPAGAVITPTAGIVARQLAKKMTTNKAKFVDAVVRAGDNGKRITNAYLRAVPKSKRSAADLADLLVDPNIDINALESIADATVQQALEIAKGKRYIDLSAAAAAGVLTGEQDGD